ncbi:MAG: FAD-binding oxidoreductase, partial [Pseudomonadota bacterium]
MKELFPVSDDLRKALTAALGPKNVTDASQRYLEEPRGRFEAQETVLVTPETTEGVSSVIRLCSEYNTGVVPYGGGTGLVGGQTKPDDGPSAVILSVEKMNKVREIDGDGAVIVAEAGVILADAQRMVDEVGLLYPLSLASEGSCQIGGTLATNAGGTQVIRYGNSRDFVLGIEAVMADSSVYRGLKKLRKDNTGYDLRHLLIGSEGTLGIITAASVRLMPRPSEVATAMVVVPGPSEAVALLKQFQRDMDGLITAFELMHRLGLSFVRDHIPNVDAPFQELPEWSILIDLGGGRGSNLNDRLEQSFEVAMANGLVLDAVLASSEAQRRNLWAVRESIPLGNRAVGAISNHDISVPVAAIPDFIAEADSTLIALGDVRVGAFGHVGDGNLHYNVYPADGRRREEMENLRPLIKETVHDLVASFDGS